MDEIPKVCLTMGIGTVRTAKDVLVMFNGSSRASRPAQPG